MFPSVMSRAIHSCQNICRARKSLLWKDSSPYWNDESVDRESSDDSMTIHTESSGDLNNTDGQNLNTDALSDLEPSESKQESEQNLEQEQGQNQDPDGNDRGDNISSSRSVQAESSRPHNTSTGFWHTRESGERKNRFSGSPKLWKRLTKAERQVVTSLDHLRARDLSVHLYNTFALKKRLREHDIAGDTKPWRIQKYWTAWPMAPDTVPRPGESTKNSFDAPTMTRPYNSREELEEELIGVTTKIARKRFRQTMADRYVDRTEGRSSKQPRTGDPDFIMPVKDRNDLKKDPNPIRNTKPLQMFSSQSLREASASLELSSQSTSTAESIKQDDDFHDKHDTDDPESFAESDAEYNLMPTSDQDHINRVLRPTIRSVCTGFDDLLMALHRSRQTHGRRRKDLTDTVSRSLRASSRNGQGKNKIKVEDEAETEIEMRHATKAKSEIKAKAKAKSQSKGGSRGRSNRGKTIVKEGPSTEPQISSRTRSRSKARLKVVVPTLASIADADRDIKSDGHLSDASTGDEYKPDTDDEPEKTSDDDDDDDETDEGNYNSRTNTATDPPDEHIADGSDTEVPAPERRRRPRRPEHVTERERRSRLGLRDWSEVLGFAGMSGAFPPVVIERTRQRCAALFGQDMGMQVLGRDGERIVIDETVDATDGRRETLGGISLDGFPVKRRMVWDRKEGYWVGAKMIKVVSVTRKKKSAENIKAGGRKRSSRRQSESEEL